MEKEFYVVSSKYEFGMWHHSVCLFHDEKKALEYLNYQENDFRTRELMTKEEAIKLVGGIKNFYRKNIHECY